MFTITNYHDGTCVLCEKKKTVFVVTCGRGTFSDAPFCTRCLEKQAALQSKTHGGNVNGETTNLPKVH